MIGALARWIKAIGYLFTGQIDSARRVLDTNPHVVRAKYDQIVRDKVSQIQTYKQAVAGLIAPATGITTTLPGATGDCAAWTEGTNAAAAQNASTSSNARCNSLPAAPGMTRGA